MAIARALFATATLWFLRATGVPEDMSSAHCWTHGRRHTWRLDEQRPRSDYVLQVYRCTSCEWPSVTFLFDC